MEPRKTENFLIAKDSKEAGYQTGKILCQLYIRRVVGIKSMWKTQTNKHEEKNTILKWGMELNREFSNNETEMAEKHFFKMSSLAFREIMNLIYFETSSYPG